MFLLFSKNCKKNGILKMHRLKHIEEYDIYIYIYVSLICLEGLTPYKGTGYENKQQPEVI